MNRLDTLFQQKKENILNIYTTAGYPKLDSTVEIVVALDKAGADIVELGMPYSDPIADGETIQGSSQIALKNGMTLKLLFQQVQQIRTRSEVPIILMGYLNQVLQYGLENFMQACVDSGVDGLILPDLPLDIYEEKYEKIIAKHDLGFSFLVTPQTSDERILKAANLSSSFLYIVSQSSITGQTNNNQQLQLDYYERINKLKISKPTLIGFGIHDKDSFLKASAYANGAIIGSAFIKHIGKSENKLTEGVASFVSSIKE